jgi:UDPglucose--hexose-1-phosphate uridylyltransferase
MGRNLPPRTVSPVPSYRHDPILDRTVVVAAERAARPYTTTATTDHAGTADGCPFCAGNEGATPPETCRTGAGAPDASGWSVRVVPNLYPIVGGPDNGDATGAHEVVILSPAHDRDLTHLGVEQATEAFRVIRDRTARHLRDGRAFVSAFVNHRRAAGASIAHPHAQLVAPDAMAREVEAMTQRFTTDLVARELMTAQRSDLGVVEGPAAAWCPPAGWAPYMMRVAHRSTRARFDEATDAELRVVVEALLEALGRLERLLGPVPYNVVVHSAPPSVRPGEMHWHLEVVPRTSVIAGFELGTGVYANAVAPEQAAALLREA